jgi:hypothetical protein
MSLTSTFLKRKSLLIGSCFALAISTGAVTAAPLGNLSLSVATNVVAAALSCPAGTHAGYEGKYCWPNTARACPQGFHLGYEGKYCWPNG